MRSIPPIHRAYIKKHNPQLLHGDATEGGRWGRSHGWVANVSGEREANMIDCVSITACVQCHPLLFWSAESWMWILRASCSSQACLPFVAPMRQWRADESDRQRNRERLEWHRQRLRQQASGSVWRVWISKWMRKTKVSPRVTALRVGTTHAIRVICESVWEKTKTKNVLADSGAHSAHIHEPCSVIVSASYARSVFCLRGSSVWHFWCCKDERLSGGEIDAAVLNTTVTMVIAVNYQGLWWRATSPHSLCSDRREETRANMCNTSRAVLMKLQHLWSLIHVCTLWKLNMLFDKFHIMKAIGLRTGRSNNTKTCSNRPSL